MQSEMSVPTVKLASTEYLHAAGLDKTDNHRCKKHQNSKIKVILSCLRSRSLSANFQFNPSASMMEWPSKSNAQRGKFNSNVVRGWPLTIARESSIQRHNQIF